jgi:hypothetical protein
MNAHINRVLGPEAGMPEGTDGAGVHFTLRNSLIYPHPVKPTKR